MKNNSLILRLEQNNNILEFSELPLGGDDEAATVASYLKRRNYYCTVLNFWDGSLTDYGLQQIAAAIRVNKFIKSLSFRYNKISNDGLLALLSSMIDNNSITSLDIRSESGIDDNGMRQLADFLGKNKSLTSLSLFLNTISIKGIALVLEAVKKNHSLQELMISDCHLNDIHYYFDLYDFICQSTGLRKLYIDAKIGEVNFKKIVYAMEYNPFITECQISSFTDMRLNQYLTRNRKTTSEQSPLLKANLLRKVMNLRANRNIKTDTEIHGWKKAKIPSLFQFCKKHICTMMKHNEVFDIDKEDNLPAEVRWALNPRKAQIKYIQSLKGQVEFNPEKKLTDDNRSYRRIWPCVGSRYGFWVHGVDINEAGVSKSLDQRALFVHEDGDITVHYKDHAENNNWLYPTGENVNKFFLVSEDRTDKGSSRAA